MSGLTIYLLLAIPVLAVHMLAVALSKALRTYSRSRLEELSAERGHTERADEIVHMDERTDRSVDVLSVLTGLALAALLGALVAGWSITSLTGEAIVAIALALGAVGHLAAGIAGRVHAESILDSLWPIARLIHKLMWPLTALSRKIEAFAYRRSRHSMVAPRPASVEVEIHSATDQADEQFVEPDLSEAARNMIEQVVELSHRSVSEVMKPRGSIVSLPASASAEEAAHVFTTTGRSRIPLYGEHRDDIVGILYAKDLFPRIVEARDPAKVVPRKIARPPMFVPETKNALELLDEFRLQRVQLAMVVDEYGVVTGLVTLEDLMEQIVGLIDDEHDEPKSTESVIPLGDHRYEVDATVALEELNEQLDLDLPTDGDFQTLGGFAFSVLGHVPNPGETFRFEGVEFTVLEVCEHSIRKLRLDMNPMTTAATS